MTDTYTQDEVEQMVYAATTEQPVTAEGWLEHYNGNITKCAEALGISAVTLRKHRDNNTLGQFLVYIGKVYQYKNDIYHNTPDKNEWELVPSNKVGIISVIGANLQSALKNGYKATRDSDTGKVQYWRNKREKD